MFYDRFASLCREKGVSVSRGAQEAGISKSLVTKWKANQVDIPSADVLSKLSKYFQIPVSALLGEGSQKESTGSGEASISRQELKFALFRGSEIITDAMLDEVLSFAEYVAQRENPKK